MRSLLPWILGVVAAAVLVLVNDRFFLESIVVTSSSMEPTLFPNERIFLQHRAYGDLRRFDVVVIDSQQAGHRIVKRIVGLPGECVALREGWLVSVGPRSLRYAAVVGQEDFRKERDEIGEHLIQLRTHPQIHYDTLYGGRSPYCLKEDEYYALGDNRLASGDSRVFGPFRRAEIQGKLRWVWYSYDKISQKFRAGRFLSRVSD